MLVVEMIGGPKDGERTQTTPKCLEVRFCDNRYPSLHAFLNDELPAHTVTIYVYKVRPDRRYADYSHTEYAA